MAFKINAASLNAKEFCRLEWVSAQSNTDTYRFQSVPSVKPSCCSETGATLYSTLNANATWNTNKTSWVWKQEILWQWVWRLTSPWHGFRSHQWRRLMEVLLMSGVTARSYQSGNSRGVHWSVSCRHQHRLQKNRGERVIVHKGLSSRDLVRCRWFVLKPFCSSFTLRPLFYHQTSPVLQFPWNPDIIL